MRFGIINVGFGNISAITNQCEYMSISTKKISLPDDITDDVTHLILPGVGSYDYGMKQLRNNGMDEAIKHFGLHHQRPLLGICLGMHLLGTKSDEGTSGGLGIIAGTVKKLATAENRQLRLPHIGWRHLHITKKAILFPDVNEKIRMYFTHSYHFVPKDMNTITSTTVYGESFCASFEESNIIGVQFHPEKSHRYGTNLLKKFVQV